MPEKGVPAPFGALPAHFFRRPEKSKNCTNFAYFPWWAHGPYSPGLGPLLLSTRGGAIGPDWGFDPGWWGVPSGVQNAAASTTLQSFPVVPTHIFASAARETWEVPPTVAGWEAMVV